MKIVVALGGNALTSKKDKGTHLEVIKNLKKVTPILCSLIAQGHNLVITHGSGPQAGALLLQKELSKKHVPGMPLDVLDAEIQGQLGYLIQQVLLNDLDKHKIEKHVVTVISRVVVDNKDPAFKDPLKPVGPFYTKRQAQKLKKPGVLYKEDSGRGWRRVVPSPYPKDIVESSTIKKLVKSGIIVIAVGGGGIPVVKKRGKYEGVEAVVDKDLASSLLAHQIRADLLLIITGIDYAYLHYGTKHQKPLKRIHLKDAKNYLKSGEFAEGSMAPKIRSAIEFIKKGGKRVIITNQANVSRALKGKRGTHITK